jgi:ACS family hexuronate transporter-like MFS transporter
MMLVSLISYVDRNTLALLAPVILKDTGLSNQQYGYIISAFSFAYMFGNPVWGMLLDRIGLRNGMTAAVALWTAASTCHAFASGLFSFGLARAILGFGEGATFPGGLRTAVQTLSIENRSKGIAISYSGGSLGAVVTPFIVTPVAIWLGWRGAFWCTGIIGTLWIIAWRFISRRPEIREYKAPVAATPVAKLQWNDPRIWAFMAIYGIAGSPLAFILYNASLYFVQGMHRTQVEMGQVLWIPPLGWEIGYFFWGWITDALPRGDGYLPALRRQMMYLTLLMLPLAAIPHWDSFGGALALMFFTMFIGGGFIISAMSYVTRVFASDRAGLIAGLGAGSWSLIVAILAPGFGRLFDQRAYAAAFALSALVPIIGYAAFHILSKRTISGQRPEASLAVPASEG